MWGEPVMPRVLEGLLNVVEARTTDAGPANVLELLGQR